MEKKEESSDYLSECISEIIKSKYILQEIFSHLERKQFLEMIKFNKQLKDRLDITLKDYKEYPEIMIELISAKNIYGKFINILKEPKSKDEEDKGKYYHIFFDDNTDEINKYDITKDDKVNKITIIIDRQIISLRELFSNCECIESIIFKRFYRNNVIDMSYMFYNCSSLKYLDLSNFNTGNVKNMNFMFSTCPSLEKLNFLNLKMRM